MTKAALLRENAALTDVLRGIYRYDFNLFSLAGPMFAGHPELVHERCRELYPAMQNLRLNHPDALQRITAREDADRSGGK